MSLLLSLVLRGGVLLAALLVFLGGLGTLRAHGGEPALEVLRAPQDPGSWALPALLGRLARGDLGALTRLGLWVLILTPVARVALSALLFAWERDWVYTAVALWVLLVLVLGLLGVT